MAQRDFIKRDEIKFGDIRDYCSRIDRISICMQETLSYENFIYMDKVPHSYDDYYLYGFGVIDSEFESQDESQAIEWWRCMEFMLSKTPKSEHNKKGD